MYNILKNDEPVNIGHSLIGINEDFDIVDNYSWLINENIPHLIVISDCCLFFGGEIYGKDYEIILPSWMEAMTINKNMEFLPFSLNFKRGEKKLISYLMNDCEINSFKININKYEMACYIKHAKLFQPIYELAKAKYYF